MLAYRRTALRRRVVVNTKTDKAFRGLLWVKRGPLVVLRDVELLEGRQAPVSLEGEIVLERANIDFVQVLAGEG